MKRKIILGILTMVIGLSLMGCGGTEIKTPKVEIINTKQKETQDNANTKKDIKKEVNTKIIGQIIEVNKDTNNNVSIQLDRVDFYFGNDLAYKEYVKDCEKQGKKADSKENFDIDYYIKNEEYRLYKYEVSENVKYYLSDYNNPVNSSIGKEVKHEAFTNHINKYKSMNNGKSVNRANMFWINIENGKVIEIRHQYTP